jgi:hypothetical protein
MSVRLRPSIVAMALVALLLLGPACSSSDSCPTEGADTCRVDDQYADSLGRPIHESCAYGDWTPHFCDTFGDGGSPDNCLPTQDVPNLTCINGFCVCG